MRILLDTNILISAALFPNGTAANHREVPAHPVLLVILHQPLDVFPVHDVDHSRVMHRSDAGLDITDNH